jgi:hypothetical protein
MVRIRLPRRPILVNSLVAPRSPALAFLHLRDRLPIHVGRSEVEVALIEDPDVHANDASIENAVKDVLSDVGKIIESTYPDAYLAPLFKNVKKCTDIRSRYEEG